MRTVKDCYFKDYGDGYTFISGLPIPTDEDGVCRDILFVNCDFHPGCNIPHERCSFERCDGRPGPEVSSDQQKAEKEQGS